MAKKAARKNSPKESEAKQKSKPEIIKDLKEEILAEAKKLARNQTSSAYEQVMLTRQLIELEKDS